MMPKSTTIIRPDHLPQLAALGAFVGALIWTYWPTLATMVRSWSHDARYSHGWLVPAFSLAWLWSRRGRRDVAALRSSGWGLAPILVGAMARLVGGYFHVVYLEGLALLPMLAGLAILLGGWRALRWSGPAIAFLAFMIPLPYRVEHALSGPLQQIATLISTFVLQTLGISAVAEGNVIILEHGSLGVVEACSGLSMMLLFFALSTAVTMVIRRNTWEKALIILSAVPIALTANVARITVTGVMHELVGSRLADLVFHDLAGWLMMPLALALLGLEIKLIAMLLIEPPPKPPVPVMLTRGEDLLLPPGGWIPAGVDEEIHRAAPPGAVAGTG